MAFNIQIKQESYGPMISIQQDSSYVEEVLTVQEAEKLKNQLTKVINDARNILNSKIRFKL